MTDLPNTGGHTNRKILKLEIEIPRQPSRQCNGGMMMMTMILSYFVRCCCCCCCLCTYKHRGIMHLVFSASNRHSTYFPLPSVCRHIPSTVQRSHLPLIPPSTSLLYCRLRYWRWRWRWCLSLHASPSNQPFLPACHCLSHWTRNRSMSHAIKVFPHLRPHRTIIDATRRPFQPSWPCVDCCCCSLLIWMADGVGKGKYLVGRLQSFAKRNFM